MKVPNKILNIVNKLAKNEKVNDQDRQFVIDWCNEGLKRRAERSLVPIVNNTQFEVG